MAHVEMSCSGSENTTRHPCILHKCQTHHQCITADLGHLCKGHSPHSGCRRLKCPLVYLFLHPSSFRGPHSPSATYLRSGAVQRGTWRLLAGFSPSSSPPISAIRGSLCFPWRPSEIWLLDVGLHSWPGSWHIHMEDLPERLHFQLWSWKRNPFWISISERDSLFMFMLAGNVRCPWRLSAGGDFRKAGLHGVLHHPSNTCRLSSKGDSTTTWAAFLNRYGTKRSEAVTPACSGFRRDLRLSLNLAWELPVEPGHSREKLKTPHRITIQGGLWP